MNDTWTPSWYAAATEEQQAEFRTWFIGLLQDERVNVTFTKADGTERHLHCSLHPDLIPAAQQQNEQTSTRKRSEAAQSVWDLDKQAWRSFRWDSIQQFSFSLGELHV